MKYVVTGGAGFIGSHIAEQLLAGGHDVTVLDNFSEGSQDNIDAISGGGQLTCIRGDIRDTAVLDAAVTGAHGIFHEAAISSVPRSIANPPETNDVNVSGTLNVLLAAQRNGVKNLVFASTAAVYGDAPGLPKDEEMPPSPESPYAVSKLAGEYYGEVFSRRFGIRTVSLRYFNVYGPRQNPASEYAAVIPRFITRAIAHAPPVIYGDGSQTRDFIYVRDVAAANIRAMESGARGVFNIAGGKPVTIDALAKAVLSSCNVCAQVVHEKARTGDILHSHAAIDRAGKAFGFHPQYTLEEGLAETTAWYQSEHRRKGRHQK